MLIWRYGEKHAPVLAGTLFHRTRTPLCAAPVAREHDSLSLRGGLAWKHRQRLWLVPSPRSCQPRLRSPKCGALHPFRYRRAARACGAQGGAPAESLGPPHPSGWHCEETPAVSRGRVYVPIQLHELASERRSRREPRDRRALKKRSYWVKNCANFHSNRVQSCDGCRALPV